MLPVNDAPRTSRPNDSPQREDRRTDRHVVALSQPGHGADGRRHTAINRTWSPGHLGEDRLAVGEREADSGDVTGRVARGDCGDDSQVASRLVGRRRAAADKCALHTRRRGDTPGATRLRSAGQRRRERTSTPERTYRNDSDTARSAGLHRLNVLTARAPFRCSQRAQNSIRCDLRTSGCTGPERGRNAAGHHRQREPFRMLNAPPTKGETESPAD